MSIPDLHRPFESSRRTRYVEFLGSMFQEAESLGIPIADLTDMDDDDLRVEAKRIYALVKARRSPFAPTAQEYSGPIDDQLCTVCKDGKPRNRCRCALR